MGTPRTSLRPHEKAENHSSVLLPGTEGRDDISGMFDQKPWEARGMLKLYTVSGCARP